MRRMRHTYVRSPSLACWKAVNRMLVPLLLPRYPPQFWRVKCWWAEGDRTPDLLIAKRIQTRPAWRVALAGLGDDP